MNTSRISRIASARGLRHPKTAARRAVWLALLSAVALGLGGCFYGGGHGGWGGHHGGGHRGHGGDHRR